MKKFRIYKTMNILTLEFEFYASRRFCIIKMYFRGAG